MGRYNIDRRRKSQIWNATIWRGPKNILNRGESLLYENTRAHTTRVAQDLRVSFGCDIVTHPPYSSDLAPSDIHLFTNPKEILGGKRFCNDEEVKETVAKWLSEVERKVFDRGIKKLVPGLKRCI
ncbi:hypothetical protein AAG570_009947 [Ranatra chinensis]|uniref:Histone-lysine N-methyltransferase SETMAR n=1 Tax=Ranatra chinensis TaxID=642074 RepID=A0ABD0YQK4_9HEMI